MKRRRVWRKSAGIFLLLLSLMLSCVRLPVQGAKWQGEDGAEAVLEPLEELTLYARSAVLLDGSSGRVLYEKDGFTPMAMASTTKIMTCILALENGSPEDELEVSAYAASMPKVKLYVKKGEKYSLKDLLHSLMLESHNDAAVVIAENLGQRLLSAKEKTEEGGSLPEEQKQSIEAHTLQESKLAVAAFAGMMNAKARELGCENTYFITPNGLDAQEVVYSEGQGEALKEHATTAAELARIMAYCVGESPKSEEFLEITRCPSYYFSANGRSYSLSNHNAFLNMMDGALSGKTGFTGKAGYCYVGALRRGERTFIVALLACGWPNNKSYKWSDTKKLMGYGLEHYSYVPYARYPADLSRLEPVPVLGGQGSRLGEAAVVNLHLTAEETVSGGLLLREDESIVLDYDLPTALTAPVEAGEQVGAVRYLLGDTVLLEMPVVAAQTVQKIDFWWCFRQIISRFMLPCKNFQEKCNSC